MRDEKASDLKGPKIMANAQAYQNLDPAALPTATDALGQPKTKSTWPMVVGVIAIVLGGFGALANGIGTITVFLTDVITDLMQQAPSAQSQMEAFRATEPFKYWSAGASCFATILSIVLLVAGILLIKRRASVARLYVIWSVLRIISVIVGTSIGYISLQHQFEAMANDPNASSPPMAGLAEDFAIAEVFIGSLWGWALPIFLLIWFSRSKIKSEVAEWGEILHS